MSLHLYIPDSVARAIRIPEDRLESELCVELAIALYSQGFLSFGKARELAAMGKYEFGQLLGKRGIVRHYGPDECKMSTEIAQNCQPKLPKPYPCKQSIS